MQIKKMVDVSDFLKVLDLEDCQKIRVAINLLMDVAIDKNNLELSNKIEELEKLI